MVVATDGNTAVAIDVGPGQANDAPLLVPMVEATVARVPRFDEVVGDEGFDGDTQRDECIDRGPFPNIPNTCNRVEPWPFLPDSYRARSTVERLIGKVKQYRRVATRYDKLEATFLGMIHLALGFIRLKSSLTVNTA